MGLRNALITLTTPKKFRVVFASYSPDAFNQMTYTIMALDGETWTVRQFSYVPIAVGLSFTVALCSRGTGRITARSMLRQGFTYARKLESCSVEQAKRLWADAERISLTGR